MNLGIFLYRGGSFRELKEGRHDDILINYYIKRYSKNFDNVYIFSYEDERRQLPENCKIIRNKYHLPLFIYQFLMPIINMKHVRGCDVFRVFHISGSIPAVISKILFKKRYITTYGYLWIRDLKLRQRGFSQYMLAKLIEFFGFRYADKVIVTINETHDYVNKSVPEERIVKIENSVDTGLFKPIVKKKGKFKKLVYVGRLEESQKNLKALIKAVSLLNGNHELMFVGGRGKNMIDEYMSYAKELDVNLEIHGPMPHSKLPEIYNMADIFCLVSHWEGMPKVLLEAMSCGTPCLCSETKEIKEIVNNETAILCGTSPEDITGKLNWIVENPEEARRIGRNAREFIINNLSADVLITKEIKLLKEIGKK